MLGNEITPESVVFNLGINAGLNAVVGKINQSKANPNDDILTNNPVEQYTKKLMDFSYQEISEMTIEEIEPLVPSDWELTKHNPYYHVYDNNGKKRFRFDPPDSHTPYYHMHAYDEQENLVDLDGNRVKKSSPDGHIKSNYLGGQPDE
ncbi:MULTISPECIES: hypothetical protein [unclassified Granulicatella]|uniref:hypothetical protein n=1 Tax=unclassified Granulicatella TaxID=2630493 RepID=UPI0010744B0B|nr:MULTISPECIES: hypothetical protein [unclassified Granulicatella]MBF0780545.1 hypothetical protein [Granulicatella sp. 19428wC4_WM01]TFU94949.1 hypothetical protein E4T68_05495 [Granulicatella sp. WM01]